MCLYSKKHICTFKLPTFLCKLNYILLIETNDNTNTMSAVVVAVVVVVVVELLMKQDN